MWCLRRSDTLDATEGICKSGGKAQVTGHFGHQEVRRESAANGGDRRRRGGSVGAGGGVLLTTRWCEPPRGVLGRGKWGVEDSYGRASKRARERVVGWCSDTWKRGSLAGSMGGCSMARGRAREILRTVLRSPLRPALRGIFQTVLRNRGVRGFSVGAKVVRTPG